MTNPSLLPGAAAIVLLSLGAPFLPGTRAQSQGADPAIPELLSQTGLYADFAGKVIADDHLPYTPQYPLWSDGADKRRWIHLPPGTAVDATDPAHWVFPLGTRLYKEFSLGNRLETRLMQRNTDGTWSFVTYLWEEDGSDARLAADKGHPAWRQVPGGFAWDIPGRWDCLACHESPDEPVLGFDALQLSPDRDPLAPNAELATGLDLDGFVRQGIVQNLDRTRMDWPPRVAGATPEERALRGYLRANCSNCHSPWSSLADLELFLHDADAATLQNPDLHARMATRDPNLQMPPLGTRVVDAEAMQLWEKWQSMNNEDDQSAHE